MTKRIVIVGAGITGLTAARTVLNTKPDLELIVLEASHRPGGLVETQHSDHGLLIEHGPDSFVGAGPVEALVQEILPSEAVLALNQPMQTFIARGNELYTLPRGMISMAPVDPWQLFVSGLFSPVGKLRMAMERWLPASPVLAEAQSVESFFLRRFGRELVERVVGPLLGTIYHTPINRLSMQAILPTLLAYEQDFGSVTKGIRNAARRTSREGHPRVFRTLRDGMAMLTDRLAAALSPHVKYNSPVERIAQAAQGRLHLKLGAQGNLSADAVILTTPSHTTARLVEHLDPELARLLGGITYSSQCAFSFAWKRHQVPHPMQGTGFIVATKESRTVRSCTWSSAKWPGRAPGDDVLIRCFLDADDAAPDVELQVHALEDLRELMGIEAPPYFCQARRRAPLLPCYEVGHLSTVRAIMQRLTALDRLYLAGNTFQGVNLAACIQSGREAAFAAMNDLEC